MQYKYDEEGGQFLTFVLTFLLLVLLPLTYSLLTSRVSAKGKQGWLDARGQKVAAIRRLARRSLRNPKIGRR
jgi:translocation protein SEC63